MWIVFLDGLGEVEAAGTLKGNIDNDCIGNLVLEFFEGFGGATGFPADGKVLFLIDKDSHTLADNGMIVDQHYTVGGVGPVFHTSSFLLRTVRNALRRHAHHIN